MNASQLLEKPVSGDDDGICCEKCGSPQAGFAVCRVCGYYAKLGHFVEIDHEMEGFEVEKEPEPFRLPTWTFIPIAGSVAIVAEAVSIAVLLPINSIERLICSAVHLALGVILLSLAQVRASFLAIMDDPDVTIMDCIACPPKPWGAVLKRLPKTSQLFTFLSIGGMSLIMSVAVLRAIPYGAIFDGEVPEYEAETNLLAQVIANAPKPEADPDMDMEDALSSFADQAAGDLEMDEALEQAIMSELMQDESDAIIYTDRCIVIGYNAVEDEPAVRSVIVATANRNPLSTEKWRILGSVPVLDEKRAAKLYREFQGQASEKPFVFTNLKATWVTPSVKCEVSYEQRGEGEETTAYNLELAKLYGF